MASSVKNPRRAPRIPARMEAHLAYGSAVWHGWTVDFGPGGCHVEVDRPLVKGTALAVALRCEELGARLRVDGTVAWARGLGAGIAFTRSLAGADPRDLYRRLLERHPALDEVAGHVPASVSLDAQLVVSSAALAVTDVGGDETQLLSVLHSGASVRAVAMRSRLPPDRFARALYMLLQKGVLSAVETGRPANPAAGPAATSAPRPGAASGDSRSPGRASRGAARDDRLAAEIALALRSEAGRRSP